VGIALAVPFCAQEADHCGDAALEMVFRYYGVAVDRNEIAKEVFVPALRGTIPDLLANAATEAGFSASVVRGDLRQLKKWLCDGIPPIIFLGPAVGSDKGHFVVVTGIDGNGGIISAHTGSRRNRRYKAREFLGQWKTGGFTSVLITNAHRM